MFKAEKKLYIRLYKCPNSLSQTLLVNFSADSFRQVSRRLSDLFVVDCPSKLHTLYSIIDSLSGVIFFFKVISVKKMFEIIKVLDKKASLIQVKFCPLTYDSPVRIW